MYDFGWGGTEGSPMAGGEEDLTAQKIQVSTA